MRTLRNQIRAFAVAAIIAATLITTAGPAAAGQAATITVGGVKQCIILESSVMLIVPDYVQSVLMAVLDKLGC